MVTAATRLLDALPSGLLDRAHRELTDVGRTDWAYYPKDFHGVSLNDLPPSVHPLVRRLVHTGVSDSSFARIAHIMSLEWVLDAREDRPHERDPGRYFFAVYGDPISPNWAWRYEGHHVSINVTVVDGAIASTTPLFLGANPAEVPSERSRSRPFADEEDAARTLLSSFDSGQRELAVICPTAPIDVVAADSSIVPQFSEPGNPVHPLQSFQDDLMAMTPNEKAALSIDLSAPVGINQSHLHSDQQDLLRELVEVYVTRLPPYLQEMQRARLDADGWGNLWFAWAGSATKLAGHYYRIQGPSLLIEYDCVQNDGNHVHAVWRDPIRDFANDLLGNHLIKRH